MRRITYILIFLLSFPFLLISTELLQYPCYKITEKPTIDGKIEESVWSSIPTATGFFILGRDTYAYKQTWFKACWDKEGIYIAVRCEEPDVKKIVAKQPDEGSLWIEDSIEIFFFPKKADNYFQFVINTIGSRWNGIGSGGVPQPLWNWQAKTYIGKDYWSLEVMIPFEVLGRVPENEEKWSVNIARNILTGPSAERYTCWPHLQSGFHDIANFGSFIFKEKVLSSKDVNDIEKGLNAYYYNYLKEKINTIATHYSEYKDIVEKAIEHPKFKEEGNSLKEVWELVKDISNKKEASIEELISVLSKSSNVIKKSESLKSNILLESLFEGE